MKNSVEVFTGTDGEKLENEINERIGTNNREGYSVKQISTACSGTTVHVVVLFEED